MPENHQYTYMMWWQGKPKHVEETHADMRSTCKLHTVYLPARNPALSVTIDQNWDSNFTYSTIHLILPYHLAWSTTVYVGILSLTETNVIPHLISTIQHATWIKYDRFNVNASMYFAHCHKQRPNNTKAAAKVQVPGPMKTRSQREVTI